MKSADEALAVDSLKASSVKDSSSSFLCHHLLSPFPPSLVFVSPSVLSFTVRKDYLWRDNSVPSCTGKDGGPQTLLQWVTLTAGGNCKDKIWVLVFFDAAALCCAAHASASGCEFPAQGHGLILSQISAISLACATRACPSAAFGAFLCAFVPLHVCDMGAWTMRADKQSVALVMRMYSDQSSWASGGGGVRWLPVKMSTTYGPWKRVWFQEIKIWHGSPMPELLTSLCSFSQSPHGRLLWPSQGVTFGVVK